MIASAISPAWIGVDWGTTNLRAYAMGADGTILAQASSNAGMASLSKTEFEPALRAVLSSWSLPSPCRVVACGMVGSRQGWQEAPYRAVPCPAAPDAAVKLDQCGADLSVFLLSGVKQMTPPDVMRGEETQIAGFLNLNPDWDGVICLPGTHSKWVHVSAGEIVSFRTFMTGELFECISTQTVLRHSLGGSDWDDQAFDTGLSDTLSRPETLAGRLFGLRAADLLTGQSAGTARADLSGALIGAELAATRAYWLGQQVALIGTPALCDLYARALKHQGLSPQFCPAQDAICAGLRAAYQDIFKEHPA